MKSTGLFGKNSGKVGGVVYSSYRGEQIVRAYQPRVANPSTPLQIAQRAKFKLVSQLGASLSAELASFVPKENRETSRNAWLKKMLKKAVYNKANGGASLPAEEIVLTNSTEEVLIPDILEPDNVSFEFDSNSEWQDDNTRFHAVIIGYNEGSQITIIQVIDEPLINNGRVSTEVENARGFLNVRALAFLYKPSLGVSITYDDYEMSETEVTLSEIQRIFGRNINYTATTNVSLPRQV